jgi:hypothetical protein
MHLSASEHPATVAIGIFPSSQRFGSETVTGALAMTELQDERGDQSGAPTIRPGKISPQQRPAKADATFLYWRFSVPANVGKPIVKDTQSTGIPI